MWLLSLLAPHCVPDLRGSRSVSAPTRRRGRQAGTSAEHWSQAKGIGPVEGFWMKQIELRDTNAIQMAHRPLLVRTQRNG
jgi:hypothetical protein